MKKFISAAAALATALSCTALSAGAMFEELPSRRIWDNEIEIFSAMDNGSLVTDLDKSGTFDLTDCFLLYSCAADYETAGNIQKYAEAVADYDNNGILDSDDAIHLIRYYLVNNKLTRDDLKKEFYDSIVKQSPAPEDTGAALSSYTIDMSPGMNFTKEVMLQADYLMASYPVFCEMLGNGELDFDINGDGRVFFDDINYLWVYSINDTNCQYMDFSMNEAAYLPGDMYYPCQKAYVYMHNEMCMSWVCEYGLMYCLEKYGADPQYLTNDYYESVFKGSGKYDFGKWAEQEYKELLPKSENLVFNSAKFNREYIEFTQNRAENKVSLPDTNGDGVLDVTDTFNAYIFMDDLYSEETAETTILPADVWKYFTEECDLNGNGMYGDIHDLNILNLYATEDLSDEAMLGFFDNYAEKFTEYTAKLSNGRDIPAAKYSPEKYRSPVTLSAEPTGDANADGDTDMADVVMIMQTLANPDKYKLSALGRFNGDVNETGNGITVMDAQEIQTRLLNS